jgi:hypothetical protein
MKRRAYLAGLSTGLTFGAAGCVGGEVVTSVTEDVIVDPGDYWATDLPAAGDGISYRIRAERRFDVYVFASQDSLDYYKQYINGGDPPEQPAGVDAHSSMAAKRGEMYEVATKDEGSRESFDVDGAATFVVDHSDYRDEGAQLPENEAEAEPLSVFVDLELTSSRLPF